ncbi:hypothetical protein LTR86_003462 [Recurvomyces mirabilis]|nr:hypothetical protein LTR86_003462 [Recurvomyces mirabilis]
MDSASSRSSGISHFALSPTDARTTLVTVGIIFTSIGVLTLLLRILTIIFRHRALGWDDLSMALGFLASMGFAAASFVSLKWGVGRVETETLPWIPDEWPSRAIGVGQLRSFVCLFVCLDVARELDNDRVTADKEGGWQAIYVIKVFYYLALFFIKMSILCLYLRLSSNIRNRFWKGTLITMAVIVVQFISTMVIVGVQCHPRNKYLEGNMSGRCVNITAFFYATNIFPIVTDVIILSLPIPMLIKLQQPRGHKIGLLATFLVGAVATLASCIRLYSVRIYTESGEALKDAAPINTWSYIEIYLAMLCASVPAFRPLFKDISKHGWWRAREITSEKRLEDFEKQERYTPSMKELPPIPEDDLSSRTDHSSRRGSGRGSGEDVLVAKPEPVMPRAPRMSHLNQSLYCSVGYGT